MLFNQLTAYKIHMPKDPNNELLEIVANPHEWREHLTKGAMARYFRPLTEHQQKGSGWEAPLPDINQEFLLATPDGLVFLLCYRTDERKIPNSAVKEQVEAKVRAIEKAESRKVPKLEKATIRDNLIAEKIPHTLPTPSRVFVVVDMKNLVLLIGTSSETAAGAIKSVFRNDLLPHYEIDEQEHWPTLIPPVYCRDMAADHMTQWLLGTDDDVPEGINLGEMVAMEREKSKNIIVSGQPLDTPHVLDTLRDDYRPYALEVCILSGDMVMAATILDRHGSFNKITIPDEIKRNALKDAGEDVTLLDMVLVDLAKTALLYDFVARVIYSAFSNGEGAETVTQKLTGFYEHLAELGATVVASDEESDQAA